MIVTVVLMLGALVAAGRIPGNPHRHRTPRYLLRSPATQGDGRQAELVKVIESNGCYAAA